MKVIMERELRGETMDIPRSLTDPRLQEALAEGEKREEQIMFWVVRWASSDYPDESDHVAAMIARARLLRN